MSEHAALGNVSFVSRASMPRAQNMSYLLKIMGWVGERGPMKTTPICAS